MRKNIFLLSFILILFSCKSDIPENIIEPQKMRDILVNIHYVDGYLTTFSNADSAQKIGSVYYNSIYKKFGIDSAKYSTSLNYYNDNPDMLNKIYKEVTAELNKQLKLEEKLVNKNVVSQ